MRDPQTGIAIRFIRAFNPAGSPMLDAADWYAYRLLCRQREDGRALEAYGAGQTDAGRAVLRALKIAAE